MLSANSLDSFSPIRSDLALRHFISIVFRFGEVTVIMANAHGHRIGYSVSGTMFVGIAVSLAYFEIVPWEIAAISSIGFTLGVIFDPDLRDSQQHRTRAKQFLNKNTIVGYITDVYWYPFARAVPHRHFLSHAPLISSFIAILYLTVPFMTIASLLLAGDLSLVTAYFSSMTSIQFLSFLFGWTMADSVHALQDGWSPD